MNTKHVTLVVLTLVCLIALVVLVGREGLQEENISLVKWDSKPCPKGVITVMDKGRLCNQIFEYVSVWVLARRHGLLPFVPNTIHNKLKGLFAHLSIPPLSELIDSSRDCPKLNKNSLNRASSDDLFDVDDRAIRTNESEDPFVLREYVVLIRFIVPILDEVKEEFQYRPEIVSVAQTRLRWSRSRLEADHGSRETLFVGIHVRRDDYFRAFQAFGVTSYADVGYYRHAVSWLLRKLTSEATSAQNIAFVLASDDPGWCKEVLVPELRDEIRAFGNHTHLGGSGVFFLGEVETPEVDLVLLSSCNHSIVDYGTYGLWAALLVNGWTVVYDLSALNAHHTIVEINGPLRVAGLMSKWVMLT